eukprot:GEMP01035201.1.p1 GENE.GEMP01035201.1~~GEMP01035201.1.p1  ORF type:complete len:560 (-),score=85.53 GEMP01035201.1:99-1778(-)
MNSWELCGSLENALAWSVREDSVWILRSHAACSFSNCPASRVEVEVWRKGSKITYQVEVRDFDVDQLGPFTSLSANTGETAILLLSRKGCAVFAVPSTESNTEVLPAKTLIPRSGIIRTAKWHPLSDVHVGLLLEDRWELMNFSCSSQALLTPEQTIKLRAKDFCFAEANASLLCAFRVLFLEDTDITAHRCIPDVVLLPPHLVKQCADYRWLSKPELVEHNVAILRTSSFPAETGFHELPEGPLPTQLVVLTCHPLVVVAVARQDGVVDIISLESGPALLCDRVDTGCEESVELHCFGPSTTFIAVVKRQFVFSMSLPWVEKLLGGVRNLAGAHTEIKTVVEGDVRHWTNISCTKGICIVEGKAPKMFDFSGTSSDSVALVPAAQRAISHFASPLTLPPNRDFCLRSEKNPETLCRSLAAIQKCLLGELGSRQYFMTQFVRDAPRRVQQSKEDWENLVVKVAAANAQHKRSVVAMEGLRDRERALEKQVKLVTAQLEDFWKSASIENVTMDLNRLHSKIYRLHQVVQLLAGATSAGNQEVRAANRFSPVLHLTQRTVL